MDQIIQLTKKSRFGLLGLSIIVIVLDQLTKQLVLKSLSLYQVKPFLPFWNWTLAFNEGAAFSFLANQSGWQKVFFALVALVVSIGLIYFILTKAYNALAGVAFSFILGGALGNLIDRIRAGKVTDFIDWYIGNHHWPAFNVADSFITIGVTLLIIDSIFFSKK